MGETEKWLLFTLSGVFCLTFAFTRDRCRYYGFLTILGGPYPLGIAIFGGDSLLQMYALSRVVSLKAGDLDLGLMVLVFLGSSMLNLIMLVLCWWSSLDGSLIDSSLEPNLDLVFSLDPFLLYLSCILATSETEWCTQIMFEQGSGSMLKSDSSKKCKKRRSVNTLTDLFSLARE